MWLGLPENLNTAVAIAVESAGPAPAFDQALHQDEVVAGVLSGQNTALATALVASSTAKSRVNWGPSSPSHR